ncbi:xanthine dehydrogenase molybdopterin binding subunit [Acuticoccus sp. MNP-M23]|uniref:xanthine dehydrogenase molybdopterin binding subunit n=1 Tax=Acuticoccus sp. MNP-M23 TaxID=3072793 RepID=UPI0028167822|nr:xanthine dehydrogenase molybdopterin binding subunit [Acuticoccus sp. MNP-M23]WMS44488.1 xanthine dehydrogenase molybdopterin binding subunit [Acuticoccus sp. MNP-M23]
MDDLPFSAKGRDFPATSPPTPATAEASHAPVPHDSGHKHVTGAAIYADDIAEPVAMVHVHIAYADFACGTVRANLDAVRQADGVVAVLTGDDVPGENNVGPVVHDEPMLVLEGGEGRVFYHGQPMFAVVATSRRAARVAATLATLERAPDPAVITIRDAIDRGTEVDETLTMASGDAAAAIASAPRRLTGEVDIGGQEHFALEGQVAVATPGEDDDMHVISSNQHPSECQEVVARVLGVPSHAVTVEVRRLGGGFGGKESQGNLFAAVAALAARLTGRPAKVRTDRDDDFIITGKRHDFLIEYDVGFDDKGRLLGVRFVQHARCGWSLDLSRGICDRAMFHADNCYAIPSMEVVSRRWRTNTCSNTAFRGFGGPQGIVGIERVIEHVAAAVGRDPLEIRRLNLYRADAPEAARTTHYGMVVDDLVIGDIVDELAESADYTARQAEIAAFNAASPVLKRGLSLVPVKFGISFTTTFLNQAGALVHVYKDGSVMINHGGIEMGQGLYIKVAQVVADAFGLPLERVKITATRTDKVPNTAPTAASSGADMNALAALDACGHIKARLAAFVAGRAGVPAADVRFEAGKVVAGATQHDFAALCREAWMARISLSSSGYYATPKISWDRQAGKGRPFYYFAYGAAVAEAAIDTLTGESRLLRVDILHDCGRSLNPAVDLGQIEGGFVQGAGWLMTEELVWDGNGRLATHAPSTYKIPCASDRPPDMRVAIWAKGENRELAVRRSKAVGEPPLMLGIAAHQAIGAAVDAARAGFHALDTPATPERVLAALMRPA